MGPPDASSSMAALYARNRRRAKYGEIPLSAGEVDYLSRKDEAVRRRQRLLEVRDHEKRVAQLVTQRYRDNLRRLHAHKLRGAQQAHQLQQEVLLGELHAKYQHSLQNVGSAQRQAREMLAELVADARIEQSKWAYNEVRVVRVRSGEASKLYDEEKEAEIARRKEVEDNLQRLKETSMKQRAQASIRARREQEMQIEMARRQEEAARFRRQTVKEEVFAMSRPRTKDVDAYQFTRLHCVSAPPVPTTALKPRPEVKVIRHNRAHPSAANGIDEAKKYRDEMDKKWEHDRNLRERNVEKAGQRGDHALEHVKSVKDGEKAIEWLQQLDKAQRYEQTVDYAHEFQDKGHAGGERETPRVNDKEVEEAFLRMFATHDEQLELSTHSARTEEGHSPVTQVTTNPLYHRNQRRASVDPADSDWDEGYESFTSRQRDSLGLSLRREGTTSAAFDRNRGSGNKHANNQIAKANPFSSGKESAGNATQHFKGFTEDSRTRQELQCEADNLEQRAEERQQQSQEQREQEQAIRDQESKSGLDRQAREGTGGISSGRSFVSWGSERTGDYGNPDIDSQNEQLQRTDLGDLHQRRESLDALENRLKEVLSFRQRRQNEPSQQTGSHNVHLDATDMDANERLSRDHRGSWRQQFDLHAHSEQINELQRHQRDSVEEDHLSLHSSLTSGKARGVQQRQQDSVDENDSRYTNVVNETGQRSSDRRGSWMQQSKFSAKTDQRSELQQYQRDTVEDEHSSRHLLMGRKTRDKTDGLQLRQRGQGEEEAESPSLRSSMSSRRNEQISSLQPKQRDGSEESASLRSSVSSSQSERRVEYQSRQRDQAEDGHANLHSFAPLLGAQFSLPLSDSMSSINKSFNDHLPGFGNQKPDQRSEHRQYQRDTVEEEHSSRHSPMNSKTRDKAGALQLRQSDNVGGVRESPSLRSPMSNRRNEQRSSLQPKQRDDRAESASLHLSVTSSQSERRVEYQSRQRGQAEDGHASLHSSASSFTSEKENGSQLQSRVAEEQHSSRGSSVVSTRSEKKVEYQLHERRESGESQDDLHSLVSSLHFQLRLRDEIEEENASLHSVSSTESMRRRDHQLQQRREIQEEHTSLRSSGSSSERSISSNALLHQQRGSGEDLTDHYPSVSSRNKSSRHGHHRDEAEEHADSHSSKFSASSFQAYSPRSENEPSAQPPQIVSESFARPQLLSESENEESFASISSSREADTPRRENKPSIHPPQFAVESRPQLLSENEDSFGDSVSLGSVDVIGDRGRLYIEKIHERLQHFSSRNSASSSVAQYSLPLSESMSSINESFSDHLPGYGDDSFIHKLVPMFPTPPGMLAIEQANEEGDRETQELYNVQLVDPALSRMLGDSVYSRRSAQASNLPSADARDFYEEIETRDRRSEELSIGEQGGAEMEQQSLLSVCSRKSAQAPSLLSAAGSRDLYEESEAHYQPPDRRVIDEYGEPEMEQQSLLSGSESGMSSVGFSALLHLTAGTSRQLYKSDVSSGVDANGALENEEKAGSDLDHSRRSSASDSSLSVDARFNYLVSMTAAAGESLPLHIRLPATIYGNKDMSAPPRPIKWTASSSSSSSFQENEEDNFVIGHLDQQAQVPVNRNDDGDEEHGLDRSDDREPSERSASISSNSRGNSESNDRSTPQADMRPRSNPNDSEESSHESDDEMQYESFRRGLVEGKIGSFPLPPFVNMDMSRPPPPLTSLQHSGSQSSHSSSSISSQHSSKSGRGRFDRSRAERSMGDDEKQEESFDDDRSSLFSEAGRSISRGDRSRRGESMFISIGRSADDGEERKEDDEGESPAVSLADAFRQRHPRFHCRVEENREQQKQKRQEPQSLQQQDKENTRRPNVVGKANVGSTSSRKQGQETLQATSSGGDSGVAADLTEEQQQLLDRLAFGERAQVSSQEMKERTKRLYQKLPEVIERKRQEEILRRRKERLAELREQENARRLQQKQRREQQKRREEAGN